MPTYEYECEPCRTIYMVRHGMNDKPTIKCPDCDRSTVKLISAANLNMGGWTSPTQAKYEKMSDAEEIARENHLQRNYKKVWLPPPVVHSPWDEDDHEH